MTVGLPSANSREFVCCDGHAFVVGTYDQHVVRIMRHRRADRAAGVESESLHQPDLNRSVATMALDQGNFGEVGLRIRVQNW